MDNLTERETQLIIDALNLVIDDYDAEIYPGTLSEYEALRAKLAADKK